MKKLSNYPENLVYDAHEKVLKVSVIKKHAEKKENTVAAASFKQNEFVPRRYSFDDNGGGYNGL